MMQERRHRTRSRRMSRYITALPQLKQLAPAERDILEDVVKRFPLRVTSYYLRLIDWNDPDDPLRRLIIPQPNELREWGQLDPSDECRVTVAPGLQHKYRSTALLLSTPMCAGFCRYCFRKRLFMDDNEEAGHDFSKAFEYLREHPEINNVLVSGGDPLTLSTARLERVLSRLKAIDHIRIVRVGSKVPAFNPHRILDDPDLIPMLKRYSTPERRLYLVCHFDHPNELTPQSREAVRRMVDAGILCVNQTPVVRGISDDPEAMATLWNELSYLGAPQYYVFQCRPTVGNAPFAIPIVEAYRKVERAKRRCSGLAKRVKYVMSHRSGKVEIIGVDRRFIYLKYHRALHPEDEQRLIVCHRDDHAHWYDDLTMVSSTSRRELSYGPRVASDRPPIDDIG